MTHSMALKTIANIFRRWIDFNVEARNNEGLETLDAYETTPRPSNQEGSVR